MHELSHHNFWERITRLNELHHPDHRLAKALDNNLNRAAKHAAKAAKRRYQTPWSPAFAKAWATTYYYKLALSQSRNPQRDYSDAIHHWQQKYPYLPTPIPTSRNEIIQQLQQSKRQLQLACQNNAQYR